MFTPAELATLTNGDPIAFAGTVLLIGLIAWASLRKKAE